MRKEGLVVFVCAVAVVFVAVLTPCAGQRGGGGGGWSWWENWNHGNGGDDDHTGRWNQQQASSTTTTTTTNQVVDPLSGPSQMSTVNIVHDATWSNDAILGQTESTLVVAGNPPQHALVQVDLDALGQLLGEQLNSAATLTSVELSLYFIGVTVTPFTGSLPPLIVQAVAGPLDLACTGDCTVPSASLTAQLQSPTQVAFPSTAGHLSWDITSIVEAWHTNTTATKAWTGVLLVRLGDATATSLEVKFASTEHQDAAKHPLVTIHRAIIDPPHPMTSTATTTTTTTTAATGAGGTTSVTATTTAGTTAGATVDASASVVNNNNNNNDDDDDDDDTRSAAQQGSTRAPGDGSSGNSNSNSSGSVALEKWVPVRLTCSPTNTCQQQAVCGTL
ncbi:hypothetical protein PTSG_08287 [Salpingoeca rosetta]|uniref:Membrane-associated protein n=1 Tax=Salpingoeca rosetta (strain ATCC 50818 / BSB-021) TaxID=946362 RepID=F2UJ96_SALR5|nr:uncharacterized protein PTSG_08287 [Salpingoeca rosetta]EGD77195.1 hypothetical protein PTSG_08287 [Salpingoeca rosetta]|eukprot:XP_004990539.1 hypothetical protein PTSG_08287 [Salpingoeca rosetta]